VDISGSPAPQFTARVRTCPTTAVSAGAVIGTFTDGDCELAGGGQKFDVYSISTGGSGPPRVASILPPSSGCVVPLLAEGPQVPVDSCSEDLIEIPMLTNGTYGFIVAANDATTRGTYRGQLSTCPMSLITFGSVQGGTLSAGDCASATGAPADWYLFQASAGLIHFNTDIVFGKIDASFPIGGRLNDSFGGVGLPPSGVFSDDSDSMYALGQNLSLLLQVSGAIPTDLGSYTISVDHAELRQ
jgi:hypothetical protein